MDERTTAVRTNWLRFSWNQISRANKVLLVISTLLSLTQIIVTTVILGIGSQRQLFCDKPLQLYLIIFVARVGVSLPFAIYQHLTTPRRGGRQRRTMNNNRENHEDNDNNSTVEVEQPATLVTGWANRIKSLLDLFAILWFIVGNYLVYSTSDCPANANLYYYTILTMIICGYVIFLIPVIICTSVIFCLPYVLVATRLFNINITNFMMEGGSKEEIANIPIFRYKAPTTTEEVVVDNIETSPKITHTVSIPEQLPATKQKKFKLFSKKEKQPNQDNKQYDDFTIQKSEDAVCSICLCEYEENDLICKLWCDHHYHKDCVSEWLGLNSTCPLCKQDFRGKDYHRTDQNIEEEQ